jgi:hypothetical protein
VGLGGDLVINGPGEDLGLEAGLPQVTTPGPGLVAHRIAVVQGGQDLVNAARRPGAASRIAHRRRI